MFFFKVEYENSSMNLETNKTTTNFENRKLKTR